MDPPEREVSVRVATVVMLGLVLVTAVIAMAFVAVLTDRDLFRAEVLTFAGTVLLAALGGVSWFAIHRRHWRIHVEQDGSEQDRTG